MKAKTTTLSKRQYITAKLQEEEKKVNADEHQLKEHKHHRKPQAATLDQMPPEFQSMRIEANNPDAVPR